MRCYCCNKPLSNKEATTKFSSGEFTDMCTPCLNTIQSDVQVEENLYEEGDEDEEQE